MRRLAVVGLVATMACGATATPAEIAETRARVRASAAATPARARVRIEVRKADRPGTVIAAIYDRAETFPKKNAEVAKARAVANGKASPVVELDSVPPGRYALALFLDVDGDGELSTSLIGYPSEPFGFSNDAALMPFGPPSFDACAFEVAAPSTEIHVTLR